MKSNAFYIVDPVTRLGAAWGGAGVAQSQTPVAPTTQPAAQPVEEIGAIMLGLVGVGVVMLTAWILRRVIYPEKFRLTNTPGRPNRLHPAHVILPLTVYFAGQFIAAAFLGHPPDTHGLLVSNLIVQVAWLAASLAVAAMTFRHGLLRGLGLSMRHWLYDSLRGVTGYFIILPVVVGLLVLVAALIGRSPEHYHQYLRMLPQLSPAWQAVIFVSSVVLAPLGEEVFFRGLLQSLLRRTSRSPWLAVLVTSALFATLHGFAQWRDWPSLFALSLALGYNYERCGRLWPSILLHALFNGINLSIVLWGT